MNGHFYYLSLGFCSPREQVKVHSSPHHCLSERIIKLYSCFGNTLSELGVEICVLSCILVNITGSSFSATSNWDGVKHHRLACSSAGETRKRRKEGKGEMGTSPKQKSDHHWNQPDACPVHLSLTLQSSSMRKVSSLVNLRAVASPGCPMSSFPLISFVLRS